MHALLGRVLGKLKVEEAGVSLWKTLVHVHLFFLAILATSLDWLDHHPYSSSVKVLVIGWDCWLSITEANELSSFSL